MRTEPCDAAIIDDSAMIDSTIGAAAQGVLEPTGTTRLYHSNLGQVIEKRQAGNAKGLGNAKGSGVFDSIAPGAQWKLILILLMPIVPPLHGG